MSPQPRTIRKLIIRGGRFEKYRLVLKRWADLNCQISEEWEEDEDNPYYRNERSALSVFAGALWKSGWNAFEEYSSYKRKKRRRNSRRKLKLGRVDLYGYRKRAEFVAEAKFGWRSISAHTTRKQRIEPVEELLTMARKDVVESRDESPGGDHIGIAFVVPCFPAGTPAWETTHRIKQFLGELEGIDFNFMASVFPGVTRQFTAEGKVLPGIVMLGRVPRRR